MRQNLLIGRQLRGEIEDVINPLPLAGQLANHSNVAKAFVAKSRRAMMPDLSDVCILQAA